MYANCLIAGLRYCYFYFLFTTYFNHENCYSNYEMREAWVTCPVCPPIFAPVLHKLFHTSSRSKPKTYRIRKSSRILSLFIYFFNYYFILYIDKFYTTKMKIDYMSFTTYMSVRKNTAY